jgi:hypothetical protein
MNTQSNFLLTHSEPQAALDAHDEMNPEQKEAFNKDRFMETLNQIVIFAENLSRERARLSK